MKTTIPRNIIEDMYPDVVVCAAYDDYDFEEKDIGTVSFNIPEKKYVIYSKRSEVFILTSFDREQLEDCWNFVWGEGLVLFV